MTETSVPSGKARCQCPFCGHVITFAVRDDGAAPASSSKLSANRTSVASSALSLSRSFAHRVGTFQQERPNGDLMVFFGFSLLFILLVVVGLFVCAEITRGVLAGKTWISDTYYNFLQGI